MYVCVYVYIYIYMYVCVYVCMYVCMCIYTPTHTRLYLPVLARTSFVETLLLSMEFELCNPLLGVAQIRVYTLANRVPSKLGAFGLRLNNTLLLGIGFAIMKAL